MARRKLPEELKNDGFDMTPMIDCTFQLIIFFMLVTDMANAQLEPLNLPYASKAMKDTYVDTSVLVLNVLKDGTVRLGGNTVWSPKDKDKPDENKKLEDIFIARRQNKQYQEVAGNDSTVKYPVLVRADRSTPFEHIQKILMIATMHGGVTRVQLGAKQTEGGE